MKWILKIGPRKNKFLNQFLFLIKYSPFSCRKMSFSRRYSFLWKMPSVKRINYTFRRNHPFSADCSFISQIAFLTLKAILSQETLHSQKVILSYGLLVPLWFGQDWHTPFPGADTGFKWGGARFFRNKKIDN